MITPRGTARPVSAAVQLGQSPLAGLGVQRVDVLSDQPVQPAGLLPAPQAPVGRVGFVTGELGPAYVVPGPVALSSLGTANKLLVLHGASVRAGVQTHARRAVVGDPGLSGQTRTADDQQTTGPGHELL